MHKLQLVSIEMKVLFFGGHKYQSLGSVEEYMIGRLEHIGWNVKCTSRIGQIAIESCPRIRECNKPHPSRLNSLHVDLFNPADMVK